MRAILLSSILCLILEACSHAPPVTTMFDAKWSIVNVFGQPTRACLLEDDVAKLREILIRCEAQNQ